jgi:hypothetical protein
MQLLWTWPMRMWGCSINEARYYGWRWWLHLGPMHLLVGYARTLAARQSLTRMDGA